MKTLLITIGSLFFLTSCASVYKMNDSILNLNQGVRYKEPESGKIANVRVFMIWVIKFIFTLIVSLKKKCLKTKIVD